MSWAKIDDRANENHKLLAAGADACWLWTCGLMYANRQPARDGWIPDQVLPMLYPMVPKQRVKLCAKLVEVGLWLKADGGYQIHQFKQWNKTKEQLEGEREATRLRVAEHRARNKKSNGGGNDGGNGVTPDDVPDPLRSTPLPSGSLEPPFQGTGAQRALAPDVVVVAGDPGRIPCPGDLRLTEAQRSTLVTALIPEYAIAPLEQQFRAIHTADPDTKRTLVTWRKCLGVYVSATWNDPNKRPPAPGTAPPARPLFPVRNAPRQPNTLDHLDDKDHAAALGATIE